MAAVTVTCQVGTTVHYWFAPKADEDTTGLGITVPDIVYGWTDANIDGSPSTLSVTLDSAYSWDVRLEMRDAAPVIFDGFMPEAGDLLTQLAAQGWAGL